MKRGRHDALNTFVTRPSELLHITVETAAGERETLVGTAPHPFYVERARAFVPASDLQPGDRQCLPEGRWASVLSIRHERAPTGSPFTTYNFEVAEHHTYFVGKAGVWVHNTGATPCQLTAARFEHALKKFPGNPQKAGEEALDYLSRLRSSKKYAGLTGNAYVRQMDDVFKELRTRGLNDVDLARLRLAKTPKEVLQTVDWKDYATGKNGLAKDVRGKTWDEARAEMRQLGVDPDKLHTHHIVMKEGLSETAKGDVKDSQKILADVGIDPYFGKENFAYVPNGFGHTEEYAKAVLDELQDVIDVGGGKAEVTKALSELSERWLKKEFKKKRR